MQCLSSRIKLGISDQGSKRKLQGNSQIQEHLKTKCSSEYLLDTIVKKKKAGYKHIISAIIHALTFNFKPSYILDGELYKSIS
jgi:hypothetical protein